MAEFVLVGVSVFITPVSLVMGVLVPISVGVMGGDVHVGIGVFVGAICSGMTPNPAGVELLLSGMGVGGQAN